MTDTALPTDVAEGRASLSAYQKVVEFHRAAELFAPTGPGFPAREVEVLRARLVAEEFREYIDAVIEGNLQEIADALTDVLYVVNGTGDAYGIDLDFSMEEVHSSNMSKRLADGTFPRDPDGKINKSSPLYRKPNVRGLLGITDVPERGYDLDGAIEAVLAKQGLTYGPIPEPE